MDDKIYEPIETQPVPYPQELPAIFSDTQSNANGVSTPAESRAQNYPVKKVSRDLINNQLNTRARKILGQFDLFDQGGFRAGKFSPGQSGQVILTPAGLAAKNTEGEDTFVLDAETGDAIFRGEMRAGSTVSGNVVITDGGFLIFENGQEQSVFDSKGLVSATQFEANTLVVASQQTTTSNNYVQVPGTSFTIVTDRDINVYFVIFVYMRNTEWRPYGYMGVVRLYDSFLGGEALGEINTGGNSATDVFGSGGGGITVNFFDATMPVELASTLKVQAGTHNYELQFKRNGGNGTTILDAVILNYVILGK